MMTDRIGAKLLRNEHKKDVVRQAHLMLPGRHIRTTAKKIVGHNGSNDQVLT